MPERTPSNPSAPSTRFERHVARDYMQNVAPDVMRRRHHLTWDQVVAIASKFEAVKLRPMDAKRKGKAA